MTGHRSQLRGYVIDAKGRLIKKPAYKLPRNVALAKAKSKKKYAPVPSFEVKK